ncbi:MAG: hypothetical protein NTU41_03445 [Chloroflexi bacterium]|nr:hypothetical protein [Chloroflexota bacterium]
MQRRRLFRQGRTSAADLTYKAVDPSRITEDVKNSRYSSGTGLHPSNGATVPSPR